MSQSAWTFVHPFRKAFPVEMRHFLVKNIVLQQKGPANTNRFRVFIFYIGLDAVVNFYVIS
jgi:hypothetical protein